MSSGPSAPGALGARLTRVREAVPRPVRIALAVTGGALLGVGIGLGALLWHVHVWGLLLGFAAAFSSVRLVPPAARLGFVLGWAVPVVRGAVPTSEGDLLLGATWQGYALLIGGFAMTVVVILTLPTRVRE